MQIFESEKPVISSKKKKKRDWKMQKCTHQSRFPLVSRTFQTRYAKKYTGYCIIACVPMWLRGKDSNQRPPGYELPPILFTAFHTLRKTLISCGFQLTLFSQSRTRSGDLVHACALNVHQKNGDPRRGLGNIVPALSNGSPFHRTASANRKYTLSGVSPSPVSGTEDVQFTFGSPVPSVLNTSPCCTCRWLIQLRV